MRYRRIGQWGLEVSTVGLGSWLVFDDGDQDRADRVHRAAYESGINFFDTANGYGGGAAEAVVGRALAPFRRDTVVLATKLYWPVARWPFPGANDRGLSRKHIVEQCESSLRRLDTDYLDLYQCHRFDLEVTLDETCRAMNDLITQGKVLYWGVSHWTARQIDAAVTLCRLRGWHPPISNQPAYNMLDRHWEYHVFPACRRLGLGIVNYSPLCEGVLTGKYVDSIPAGTRASEAPPGAGIHGRLSEANLDRVRRLVPVARDAGVPLAHLALAWCHRRGEVASTIVGAKNEAQVRENAAAADVVIDEQVWRRVDAILGRAVSWKSRVRHLITRG